MTATLEYMLVSAVLGWPLLLLGALVSAVVMRSVGHLPIRRLLILNSFAVLTTLLVCLLLWFAWPAHLVEGPMYGGGDVLGPMAIAAFLVFPSFCWWALNEAT